MVLKTPTLSVSLILKNLNSPTGARYNCAGTFDERTCECECVGEMFRDMEKVTTHSSINGHLVSIYICRFATASPGVSGTQTTACVNTRWGITLHPRYQGTCYRAWSRGEWTLETFPVRKAHNTLQLQDLTQVFFKKMFYSKLIQIAFMHR